MKELEIKHIVGYLPYDCKVVIPIKSKNTLSRRRN